MAKHHLIGMAHLALMAGACFSAEGVGSGSGADRGSIIKDALARLNATEDGDWTEGGLPAMERMKILTGLDDLKRDEVGKAAPGLHRGNADAAPSDLGNVGGGGDAGPTGVFEDPKPRAAPMWEEGCMPHDVAAVFTDPVFLIETAMAAMNADPRYGKNSELQSFMRHYLVAQPNIKAHQARLDKRYHDAMAATRASNAAADKAAG